MKKIQISIVILFTMCILTSCTKAKYRSNCYDFLNYVFSPAEKEIDDSDYLNYAQEIYLLDQTNTVYTSQRNAKNDLFSLTKYLFPLLDQIEFSKAKENKVVYECETVYDGEISKISYYVSSEKKKGVILASVKKSSKSFDILYNYQSLGDENYLYTAYKKEEDLSSYNRVYKKLYFDYYEKIDETFTVCSIDLATNIASAIKFSENDTYHEFIELTNTMKDTDEELISVLKQETRKKENNEFAYNELSILHGIMSRKTATKEAIIRNTATDYFLEITYKNEETISNNFIVSDYKISMNHFYSLDTLNSIKVLSKEDIATLFSFKGVDEIEVK